MNAFVIFVIGRVIICCPSMMERGLFAERVMIPSLVVKKNEEAILPSGHRQFVEAR
jgi:hypothetical protein